MRTPLPTSHSVLRRLSERFVLLVIALIAVHAWYIAGIVPTCRVVSGSMAPTLLGMHRNIECKDCGYAFVCGSDMQPVHPRAVCPNCGHAANDLELPLDVSGDGILIQKSIFRIRSPRRWEVVAFRQPQQAGFIQVKRVVGLPGEKIRIRNGDIYIDGKIQRKTLWQQWAMAVPVHDTNFQPSGKRAPPPRWQGQASDSRWGSAGAQFAHAADDDKQKIDWLEYRHSRRLAQGDNAEAVEVLETPVTDLCGYNQTRPRREEEISLVTDLMLSLTLVDWSGEGRLIVRASDGSEEFRVEIDPSAGSWEVLQNGEPVLSADGKLPRKKNLAITVSLFDQQFLLALQGRPVVGWAYVPSQPRQPTSRPLAVGAQGLEVKIEDLRVYRDVYYTHPVGMRARWGVDKPVPLGNDEYFVLGDNSPISEDSRTWPQPAVPAELLVGKPLVVHYPCRLMDWGESVFQVPDLRKIRYIR